MSEERTLIIIKPDGLQRKLAGEIISRFERKNLELIAMKMIKLNRGLAERHYDIHKGKPFFQELIDFITSGPVIVSIWQGENAVLLARKILGATSPEQAEPGTIRGDFVTQVTCNVVHASDSTETAKREIELFFSPAEILANT